jgi:hypothetical protein
MSGPLDPLSPRAREMLDNLMVPEREDPSVIAVMRAGADELDLIQETAETVREQAWPHRADDTFGLLAIHERMLGLPPDSEATLAQRQAAAKGAVQARKLGAKANWVARMTTVMRGQQWTYEENHPAAGQLTISVPWAADDYAGRQVAAFARRITPAHVEIVMRYGQGFLVGVSRVGADAL